MSEKRYEMSSPLQIPTNGHKEVEYIGSPHSYECSHRINMTKCLRINPAPYYRHSVNNGSEKELALSPQSSFSSKDKYLSSSLKSFLESTKSISRTELSAESHLHELPNSSPIQELSDNSLNHDQSAPIAGHVFPNHWKPTLSTFPTKVSPSFESKNFLTSFDTTNKADSKFITKSPCFDGDQISSMNQWYNGTQESTSSAHHCLSDDFGVGNPIDSRFLYMIPETPNQTDAAHLSPVSSIPMPSQSPRFRGSICPAIQTDVRGFRSNIGATQFQEQQFEDSPQISSPDTASTNNSSESILSDPGYGLRAAQSDNTSATSPRRSSSENKHWELGNMIYSEDAQVVNTSGLCHENYLDQSRSLRLEHKDNLDLLDLGNSQSEFKNWNRYQQLQAACISDAKENLLGSCEMEDIGVPSAACMAYTATDIDQRSFIPTMGMGNQCASNPFGIHEEYYASPWSSENVRGFDKDFDSDTIPEAQLPMEEEATISSYDTPSPKSNDRVIKCLDCDYQPGGVDQWKEGNLRRHKKEKHGMSTEDMVPCDIGDCKRTFTRKGNLNTHKEKKHGVQIFRPKRNRRNSMTENTKKPKFGGRIAKKTRTIGGLTYRPKQNRSQSVPGPLNNNEFEDIS